MSAVRLVAAARRGPTRQGGFALIEFLAAMVVLSITIGGIVAATMTAGNVGKIANTDARLNVLMTAFGEAVKALPYETCASATVYQQSFDSSEAGLPDDAEDLRNAENATLTIVDVPAGPDCPAIDSGVQPVTLRVQISDDELTRQIVKRSPDPAAVPLDFRIKDPAAPGNEYLVRSPANNPRFIIGLEAEGESQIFQYEWWCNGDWENQDPQPTPPPPDFTTNSPNDSGPECEWDAPGDGDVQQRRVALRVTEEGTNRVGTTSRLIQLGTTFAPRLAPIAQISVTTVPSCLTATPCAFNTPIGFASTGPPPADASIIQWEWNFGDGTPTSLCTPSSADPTGLSCINQNHTYVGGGVYTVRLVVVDSYGSRSAQATRNVTITGPVVIKPTINVSSSLTGSPSYGISPQTVNFSAAANADGFPVGSGGGITNYFWEFGHNGATQSGPTLTSASYTYPASTTRQTYTAKVTVTAANGATNFATVTIVLDPLVAPINIRNTRAKGDLPFIRNAYFDFQWTNVPRTVGDTISYVIRIQSGGGFCGFFGAQLYRDFTVAAGAAGTTQLYRAQFSSSPFAGFNNVCSTDSFTFSARTVRTNAGGTSFSNWSPPVLMDPEFF
jgi:PKD repeat protein/Tfp pilus assembly protein PilV